jgi:hypothetical protein
MHVIFFTAFSMVSLTAQHIKVLLACPPLGYLDCSGDLGELFFDTWIKSIKDSAPSNFETPKYLLGKQLDQFR